MGFEGNVGQQDVHHGGALTDLRQVVQTCTPYPLKGMGGLAAESVAGLTAKVCTRVVASVYHRVG